MIVASTDLGNHAYWLSSRAAGTAAMLFASAAMFVGALRAAGLAGANVHGSSRRLTLGIIHESLGLATIGALLIHGFVLMGDNFLKPSFGDIAIPFSWSYQSTDNGIGIIAGYVFMVFSLSYYIRGRVGEARWTMLHRLTVLAWAASIWHTLGEGTDRHQAWFKVLLVAPGAAALAVVLWRILGRSRVEHAAA
ncbi:MAG: hypothetical protein QOI98_1282 [Solirubrobacteraceae bacterium]|nr:hypothetical protein [Solirubrobacteraceae bacterium]